MSATVNTDVDQYLFAQTASPQSLSVDPKNLNVKMVTPVGRLSYIHLKEPRAIEEGKDPKFSATLLMNPASTTDLWKGIVLVANARWPNEEMPDPKNPQQLIRVNGEQLLTIGQTYPHMQTLALHSPLRNGDHTYLRQPQKYGMYRGTHTINASSGQKNQPIFYDQLGKIISPDNIYSGDYARLYITIYAFPKAGEKGFGKRGVTIALNALQYAKKGERIGGFDAAAEAAKAFAVGGPLPIESPVDLTTPGFGFNPGGLPQANSSFGGAPPGFTPAPSFGGAVTGFATPNSPSVGGSPNTVAGQPTWNNAQTFSPPQ